MARTCLAASGVIPRLGLVTVGWRGAQVSIVKALLLFMTFHFLDLLFSLIGGSDYKLVYRHYATLYFVFCVDSSESELGILDLIQVSVVPTMASRSMMVIDTYMNTWGSKY